MYLASGLSRRLFVKNLAVAVLLCNGRMGVAFSWYFFATPKADLVPEKINKNEKQIPIAGQSQTNRYKQNDSDSSLISHNINFSSTGINHSESIINNGSDCSYSDSSDSGCSGGD